MKTSALIISLSSLSILSACTNTTAIDMAPESYSYDTIEYYPQSYNGSMDYSSASTSQGNAVNVPDSYHVGAYHTPTPAKVQDKNWINSQNPNAYTIEIADGDKPIAVANRLSQVPKNDRSAEIKYQRDGKAYYKGVYGTYQSQQEAEKALEQLPAAVKDEATIRNWSSVQNTLN